MRRLPLNFQLYDGWNFHFIDQNCKTYVGSRYFTVNEPTTLRKIVIKLRYEDIDDFDASVRKWVRGSVYVRRSDEQCRFWGFLRSKIAGCVDATSDAPTSSASLNTSDHIPAQCPTLASPTKSLLRLSNRSSG